VLSENITVGKSLSRQ